MRKESKVEDSTTTRIQAFRELRQKFIDDGLFETKTDINGRQSIQASN